MVDREMAPKMSMPSSSDPVNTLVFMAEGTLHMWLSQPLSINAEDLS